MKSDLHNLIFVFAVLIFVIAPATSVFGQFPPFDPFSPPAEKVKPSREELGTGKYKLVYKNSKGLIKKEEIFEVTGSMIQVSRKVKETEFSHWTDGKTSQTLTRIFGEDPDKLDTKDGPVIKQETIEYDGEGKPVEKIVYGKEEGRPMNIDYRTVTRWPPGSDASGVTGREKFDRKLNMWVVIKTSPYAGKWRLTANGQQQPGEYTFDESPGVAVLRHDSKVWVLVLGLKTDPRTVALPAESKDHLGFARRLIQLRGNAEAGRLEFWLTPDLQVGEFQKTSYTLVREGQ